MLAHALLAALGSQPSSSAEGATARATAQGAAEPSRAPALALTWSAPEGCPDRAAVERDVALLLEREGLAAEEVTVQAHAQREGDRYRLEVRVEAAGGVLGRTLWAEDCTTLAEVVALYTALAIDPFGAPDPPKPTPAPPAAAPPPAVPPLALDPPRRVTRLRLAPGLDLGALPFGASLKADALFSWGILALRTGVQADAPRAADGEAAVGVRMGRASAGIAGCLGGGKSMYAAACLGFEGGGLWGRGFGTDHNRTAWEPWAAALIGADLTFEPWDRVGIWAGADMEVPVFRSRFGIRGLEGAPGISEVFAVRAVGGRLGLGLSIRLGPT